MTCYDKAAKSYSIEEEQAIPAIKTNRQLVFAYPVYFSNVPKIVRDFIEEQHLLFSGIAIQKGRCTMCYRCVNYCPRQAVTLLGKKLYEQCTIETYLQHK